MLNRAIEITFRPQEA